MPVPRPWIPLLLAALGLCACAGQRDQGMELGEQCWDSKDNDGDGRVDCADPDCARIVVCTMRLDGGVRDKGVGKKDLRPVTKDKAVPPRDKAVPPDKGSPSSYGTRCTWTGSVKPCPDGKTVCVMGLKNKQGYCTYPCTNMWEFCPAGPSGTFSACSYIFNHKNYCAFLCKFMGKGYTCPGGFGCHPFGGQQSFCWP